jgi:hypothetical protein
LGHDKIRDRDGSLLLGFLGGLLGCFLLCHSDNLLSHVLQELEMSSARGPGDCVAATRGNDRVAPNAVSIVKRHGKMSTKNARNYLYSGKIFSPRRRGIVRAEGPPFTTPVSKRGIA